jgi:hypothetical protein
VTRLHAEIAGEDSNRDHGRMLVECSDVFVQGYIPDLAEFDDRRRSLIDRPSAGATKAVDFGQDFTWVTISQQ